MIFTILKMYIQYLWIYPVIYRDHKYYLVISVSEFYLYLCTKERVTYSKVSRHSKCDKLLIQYCRATKIAILLSRLPLRGVDTLSPRFGKRSRFAPCGRFANYNMPESQCRTKKRPRDLSFARARASDAKRSSRIKLHRRPIRLAGSQANSWFRYKPHWNTGEHGRRGIWSMSGTTGYYAWGL